MAVQRASAPSNTTCRSSGPSFWLNFVEPATSRNRTVTRLSDCLAATATDGAVTSVASLARRGASAVSATASPSTWRCASNAAIAASSLSRSEDMRTMIEVSDHSGLQASLIHAGPPKAVTGECQLVADSVSSILGEADPAGAHKYLELRAHHHV